MYDADEHQHLSFIQGAGHGGSHPHLVHQFITALLENKDPYPNAKQSANITCVGLLAHESAKKAEQQSASGVYVELNLKMFVNAGANFTAEGIPRLAPSSAEECNQLVKRFDRER